MRCRRRLAGIAEVRECMMMLYGAVRERGRANVVLLSRMAVLLFVWTRWGERVAQRDGRITVKR